MIFSSARRFCTRELPQSLIDFTRVIAPCIPVEAFVPTALAADAIQHHFPDIIYRHEFVTLEDGEYCLFHILAEAYLYVRRDCLNSVYHDIMHMTNAPVTRLVYRLWEAGSGEDRFPPLIEPINNSDVNQEDVSDDDSIGELDPALADAIERQWSDAAGDGSDHHNEPDIFGPQLDDVENAEPHDDDVGAGHEEGDIDNIPEPRTLIDIFTDLDHLQAIVNPQNIDELPNVGIPFFVNQHLANEIAPPLQAIGPGALYEFERNDQVQVLDIATNGLLQQITTLSARLAITNPAFTTVYLNILIEQEDGWHLNDDNFNLIRQRIEQTLNMPDMEAVELRIHPEAYNQVIDYIRDNNMSLGYDPAGNPLDEDIPPFVFDGVYIVNSQQLSYFFRRMANFFDQAFGNISAQLQQLGENQRLEIPAEQFIDFQSQVIQGLTTRSRELQTQLALLQNHPINRDAIVTYLAAHPNQDIDAIFLTFQRELQEANQNFVEHMRRIGANLDETINGLRDRLFHDITERQTAAEQQLRRIILERDNEQIRRLSNLLADRVVSQTHRNLHTSLLYKIWRYSPISKMVLALHTTIGQLFRTYSTSDLYAFINNILSQVAYNEGLSTNVFVIDMANYIDQNMHNGRTSCTLIQHRSLETIYISMDVSHVLEPAFDNDLYTYIQLYGDIVAPNRQIVLDNNGRPRRNELDHSVITQIDNQITNVDLILVPIDLRGINPQGFLYWAAGDYSNLHSIHVPVHTTAILRTFHFIIKNQDKAWPYSMWLSRFYDMRIEEPILTLNCLLPTCMLVHCSITGSYINFTTQPDYNSLNPIDGQPTLRL